MESFNDTELVSKYCHTCDEEYNLPEELDTCPICGCCDLSYEE